MLELDRLEAERPHEVRVVVVDEDGGELAEIAGEIQLGETQLMVNENLNLPITFDLRNVPGRALRCGRGAVLRRRRAPHDAPALGDADADGVAPVRAPAVQRIGCARRRLRSGGSGCGGGGPTYRALGRMRRLSAACSRMWAHQPMTRLDANVGVNISRGRPHRSMTMPA